jgi:predicted O-linked N-acetylglucosamine transferase (SPINDLY family)
MSQVTIEQAFELAVQQHQMGRFAEAERIYRQILAHSPRHADTLHMLGLLAHQIGQHHVALELIQQSIQIDPASALNRSNLGLVLMALERVDEAIDTFHKSLEIDPSLAQTHNNLGTALHRKGDLPGAAQAFQNAIGAAAGFAIAHVNLGGILRETGRVDDAVAEYRNALAADSRCAPALINLAGALKDQGLLADAMNALEQALAIDPANLAAHHAAIHTRYFLPGCTQEKICAAEAEFAQRIRAAVGAVSRPQIANRDPDRPLRIGYVSPDFNDHVIGRNVLPLLRNHDRSQFHITCYCNSRKCDEIASMFKQACDAWRDVISLGDEQLDHQIRADQIDILVDLALHLAGNRVPVFARCPAPLQFTFAGYPGSTGLREIDYRLSDPHLDPPGSESQFPEQTIRLPSFWCYEPVGEVPEVNSLPAQANGCVTFGCLNNFCKINHDVLDLWEKILIDLPSARLVILAMQGAHRRRLLERVRAVRERIRFLDPRPRSEYLKLFHTIDIALDTFPYNGHTTSLDGLYMGVPMVTLRGTTIVGRAGVSQLTNLGLPQLIAETPADYVRIVRALAEDLPRLANLRATLRSRMQQTVLMDPARFAREIESAYRHAWRRALQ